ncbi:MAG TPA: hypothetical protein VN494_06975 [Patescibacteria group bacterium]|nr:hypothetical protein [Patescibacteria group bacterium]
MICRTRETSGKSETGETRGRLRTGLCVADGRQVERITLKHEEVGHSIEADALQAGQGIGPKDRYEW